MLKKQRGHSLTISTGERILIACRAKIPDKIFGTKWSNPVKLDRKGKVWYLFLHVFNCFSQSLSSCRETRD